MIAFMSSNCNCFVLWKDAKQMPFIMEETLCEIVCTNVESTLLGITLALLILFDELIEIEMDPKASDPSSNAIKHPF
jgi:hypothetical protein